jgi:putative ABC transport system permease protein
VKLATVEQTLEKDLAPRRFYTLLLVGFAALALTLTAVGLFGLMAYVVERRTREIGVRMAVGARPADILAQVMSEGARLVLAGCAVGFVGVLWTGDLLAGLLFETSGRDALSLAAAGAALVLTGLLACYLPARRAAAADPATALRSE